MSVVDVDKSFGLDDCPDFFSVESLPGMDASVAFIPSNIVFREDRDICPVHIGNDGMNYIPWGANNMLPFEIIDKFEEDETLGACSAFQAETFVAGGLRYVVPESESDHQWGSLSGGLAREVERFTLDNDISSYFLGISKDLKMFEFAVSVIILSEDGSKITNIYRKEAAYCRFPQKSPDGSIPYVLFANWRSPVSSPDDVEQIPVLDNRFLRAHLRELAEKGVKKMAVVTRIPSVDSLYYPIPAYGAIFRGKWYNIKRFIGIAKEAKLKNSAPIKYLIEISQHYWEELFRHERIVDAVKKNERILQVKQEMINFLTGARNSGKAIFTNFYVSPNGTEVHDIRITKIESDKEGGDWASDHAEAINMLCFAMRVHSNLVGSVPGKSQSNNSGSDKRELYTIAQALQKPYRDCAFFLHRLIIDFNGWHGVKVECPVIQLTTLDKHQDSTEANVE